MSTLYSTQQHAGWQEQGSSTGEESVWNKAGLDVEKGGLFCSRLSLRSDAGTDPLEENAQKPEI